MMREIRWAKPCAVALIAVLAVVPHVLGAQRRAPTSARARIATTSSVSQPGATQPAANRDSATNALKAGWLTRPDTVTVGDPFSFIVSVEVPLEATVQWPVISDTGAVVAMRAATRVTSAIAGNMRRETAEYSLAAWDVGRLSLGLPDVTVRTASGVRTVPLREARVNVKTVLPMDTSLHVPKPPRPLFPRVIPWWELWWPAAAVVAGLALLYWLWRRRKRRVVKKVAAPLDVFARAMHEFDRLQRLALVDAGERGRGVALSVEIVRTYIAARAPGAALSLTSGELVDAVRDDARVPGDRLTSLLAEADTIKFAHRVVSGPRARELQQEARVIVEIVEQGERDRRMAAEVARKAAEQVQREQVAQDQDDARRRSRRPKAGAQ